MAGGTCISGCKRHPKHVFFQVGIVRTFFMFFLDLFIMFNRGVTSIVTHTPCATAKRVKEGNFTLT